MQDPPKGWPRISASMHYEDAPAAIDFPYLAIDPEGRRWWFLQRVRGG